MRVLYATDGSSAAREGEALITSLFDRSLAEICVLTVKPEHFHDSLVADGVPDTAPLDAPVLDAARVAGTVAERLSRRGFAASSSTARGDPALEIQRVIEEWPLRSRRPGVFSQHLDGQPLAGPCQHARASSRTLFSGRNEPRAHRQRSRSRWSRRLDRCHLEHDICHEDPGP